MTLAICIEVPGARSTFVGLACRESLCLRDALGVRVACHAGTLWITLHHDTRDIVLRAGENFSIDRLGATIVHAFEDSRIVFEMGERLPHSGARGRSDGTPFHLVQRASLSMRTLLRPNP